METKDMKNLKTETVMAEKDGEVVEMTLAHFAALSKKGWKLQGETKKD